jgi:hypothetical protein
MASVEEFIGIIFFLLLYKTIEAEVKSCYYEAEMEFDNMFFQNSFLSESPTRSLTECSAKCSGRQKDCGCFGFNAREKKCRLHGYCKTEQPAMYAEQWRYHCPDRKFRKLYCTYCCTEIWK